VPPLTVTSTNKPVAEIAVLLQPVALTVPPLTVTLATKPVAEIAVLLLPVALTVPSVVTSKIPLSVREIKVSEKPESPKNDAPHLTVLPLTMDSVRVWATPVLLPVTVTALFVFSAVSMASLISATVLSVISTDESALINPRFTAIVVMTVICGALTPSARLKPSPSCGVKIYSPGSSSSLPGLYSGSDIHFTGTDATVSPTVAARFFGSTSSEMGVPTGRLCCAISLSNDSKDVISPSVTEGAFSASTVTVIWGSSALTV